MRIFLKAAIAALAISAAMVGAAHAQDNCPVTTTTSTGPNGEIITRREACGFFEMTTTPGNRPPTTTTTTTNRSNTTTTTTTGGNSSSTSSSSSSTSTSSTHSPPQAPSIITIPGLGSPPTSLSRESVLSSSQPGAGGWNPASPPDLTPPELMISRPVARIVLYDNNTFRGRSIGITQNTPDLVRRRFSDVASAARSQGGVWELCSEPNYGGTCVTTNTDLVLSAEGVDNTIASVRLIGP